MQNHESHELFARIGKIAAAGYSVDETVNRIMKEIETYFQPIHCSLLRVDSATNELFFASMLGTEFEKVNKIRLKMDEGIAGQVAISQKSFFIPDTSQNPNFSPKVDELTGFDTKSIIAVPLVFKNKTYGVIEIVNNTNGIPYTEIDLLILQTIADFAAISLYNAELFEKLRVQAHYDHLTGLLNRTGLNIELEKYGTHTKNGRRENDKKITTVILIDLDNFKIINDSKGHRAGDHVLKDFSSKLLGVARSHDLIFRIGGDEFLVIVYCINEVDSMITSARLCAELDNIKTKTIESDIPYSFSYGLAEGPPFDLEDLINQADEKMYSKKNFADKAS
jgi:diguanylate cyclase (GGDEF)-like protein